MKKISFQRVATIILLAIVFINIFAVIYKNREKYNSKDFWTRMVSLKKTYEESQYVNKHAKDWVPDEFINAYAGGEYVRGKSPVLIAPDTPPLGRYLIGLSGVFFANENIIILISCFFSLLFLYLIGTQIYSHKLTALLPIVMITFEPIFTNQLVFVPLLDIIQLAFLLGSFYFFNKGLKSNKTIFFLLASILTGCFISTKFFATGVTIVAAFGTVVLLHRSKERITKLLVSLPFIPFVLLLTYVKLLFIGYSLQSFVGVQKWVFLYHKSQLILPFSIWPLLFLNKWYVWYGDKPVISDPQWLLTWPVIASLSFLTIILYIARKIRHTIAVEVLMAWVVWYILFFSVGQVTARYLVIYIPVLYLLSFYLLEHTTIQVRKKGLRI